MSGNRYIFEDFQKSIKRKELVFEMKKYIIHNIKYIINLFSYRIYTIFEKLWFIGPEKTGSEASEPGCSGPIFPMKIRQKTLPFLTQSHSI